MPRASCWPSWLARLGVDASRASSSSTRPPSSSRLGRREGLHALCGPSSRASIQAMAIQSETLQVSGIRCERCVMRLGAALEGMEGLEAANANLMGVVTSSGTRSA